MRAETPASMPAPVQVLLVCSPGGHALQLYLLRTAWEAYPRWWVTLEAEDTRSLLEHEAVSFAYGPTTRNLPNLLRNLRLAWRLVRQLKPKVIVTTGAALAVPFAWVGWMFGVRVVYIESLTRIDTPSLSCHLIRPIAARIYTQWPELQRRLPNARFVGNVLGT